MLEASGEETTEPTCSGVRMLSKRMWTKILVLVVPVTTMLALSPAVASAAPVAVEYKIPFTAPAVLSVSATASGATISFDNGASVALDARQYASWKTTSQASAFKSLGNFKSHNKGMKPMNQVVGNCGWAAISFTASGLNHSGTITTGFWVKSAAMDYHWSISIIDRYGVSQQTWGGGLLARTSWAAKMTYYGGGSGVASAHVNVGPSWADTLLQGICFAGQATASAIIT